MRSHSKITAIIVAGGKSNRFASSTLKQFTMLDGKTVLWRAVTQFVLSKRCEEIIVVVPEGYEKIVKEYLQEYVKEHAITIITGGATRVDSVYNALTHLKKSGMPPQYVLIHDAARPFVTERIIDDAIESLLKYKMGAIPAVSMVDTIKVINDHQVIRTLNRDELRAIQTPQAFAFDLLYKCYNSVNRKDPKFTDDSSIVEHCGHSIRIIEGDRRNKKLTVLDDLEED